MGKSAEEFLSDAASGNSYEAIKWANQPVGTKFSGTIIDDPRSVTRKNLNDGSPEEQLPINLDTADGPRTLWVKSGFLAGAIKEACQEAGASGIAKGGKLGVVLTELRDVGKPQPAYVFKAKYEVPVGSGVSMDEIF